jgi:hypothetical protein
MLIKRLNGHWLVDLLVREKVETPVYSWLPLTRFIDDSSDSSYNFSMIFWGLVP